MPRTPRLAQNHAFMLRVSDLADGRVTILVDPAYFAGGQTNLSVAFIPRHQGRRAACRTHNLAAATGRQFEVVNLDSNRNRLQRQAVANFRRSVWTTPELCTHLQSLRGNDVALFSVRVFQQSQPCRADRVILDGGDRRFDTVLVTLEIDRADFLFVSATDAPRGDPAIAIASAGLLARHQQGFLRLFPGDIAVIRDRDVARGRRQRSESFDWHKTKSFRMSHLKLRDHYSWSQMGRELSVAGLLPSPRPRGTERG